MCIFLGSFPFFLPIHRAKRLFPHQHLSLGAKCRYRKAKKRLYQRKRFLATWNSPYISSHGSVLGKKVSARPGPSSCIPCDSEGEDSQLGKVRMWQWEREESGDFGQRERRRGVSGWRRAGEETWVVKERKAGAGGPWPVRVVWEVRGVPHLTCCQNTAKSKALALLLISRVCKGNVLWQNRENKIGGFSLGCLCWGVWTWSKHCKGVIEAINEQPFPYIQDGKKKLLKQEEWCEKRLHLCCQTLKILLLSCFLGFFLQIAPVPHWLLKSLSINEGTFLLNGVFAIYEHERWLICLSREKNNPS